MNWNGNLEMRSQCLDRALNQLSLYVKIEAKPLLELALWTKDINALLLQTSMPLFVPPRSTKRQKVDRDACRVTCGAFIVIPNVVGFLWDHKTATVPVDLSMLPSQLSWMTTNESMINIHSQDTHFSIKKVQIIKNKEMNH